MGRGIRIPNKKTFSTSSLEDRKRESILFGRRQQPLPILGRPDLWTLDIEEGFRAARTCYLLQYRIFS